MAAAPVVSAPRAQSPSQHLPISFKRFRSSLEHTLRVGGSVAASASGPGAVVGPTPGGGGGAQSGAKNPTSTTTGASKSTANSSPLNTTTTATAAAAATPIAGPSKLNVNSNNTLRDQPPPTKVTVVAPRHRHAHSHSDATIAPGSTVDAKGKSRTSLDAPGVATTARVQFQDSSRVKDKDKGMAREKEKEKEKKDRSIFGLRGLRRNKSRDIVAIGGIEPSDDEDALRQGPSKTKPKDREKDEKEKSSWFPFLAPSLSQASKSAVSISVLSASTSQAPPTARLQTKSKASATAGTRRKLVGTLTSPSTPVLGVYSSSASVAPIRASPSTPIHISPQHLSSRSATTGANASVVDPGTSPPSPPPKPRPRPLVLQHSANPGASASAVVVGGGGMKSGHARTAALDHIEVSLIQPLNERLMRDGVRQSTPYSTNAYRSASVTHLPSAPPSPGLGPPPSPSTPTKVRVARRSNVDGPSTPTPTPTSTRERDRSATRSPSPLMNGRTTPTGGMVARNVSTPSPSNAMMRERTKSPTPSRPPVSPSHGAGVRLRMRAQAQAQVHGQTRTLAQGEGQDQPRPQASVGRSMRSVSSGHLPLSSVSGEVAEREREKEAKVERKKRVVTPATGAVLKALNTGGGNHGQGQGQGLGLGLGLGLGPGGALPNATIYREVLRHASALLLRELVTGPPPSTTTTTTSSTTPSPLEVKAKQKEEEEEEETWVECEVRLRGLARMERAWSVGGLNIGVRPSSAGREVSQVQVQTGEGGALAKGDDREKKVFWEAVRDGYVLCQFINKLRPGTITGVDATEDGFKHTSNVTRCLAAATGLLSPPLAQQVLFSPEDLTSCSEVGCYRVASTIVALVRAAGDAQGSAGGLGPKTALGAATSSNSGATATAVRGILGPGGVGLSLAGREKEGDVWEMASSRILRGQGLNGSSSSGSNSAVPPSSFTNPTSNNPYGTRSKTAAASTPNLTLGVRNSSSTSLASPSVSPNSPISPRQAASGISSHHALQHSPSHAKGKKRWSPPVPTLPTVRSDSPGERERERDNASASGASSGRATAKTGKTAKTEKTEKTEKTQKSSSTEKERERAKEREKERAKGRSEADSPGPVPPRNPRRTNSTATTVPASIANPARSSVRPSPISTAPDAQVRVIQSNAVQVPSSAPSATFTLMADNASESDAGADEDEDDVFLDCEGGTSANNFTNAEGESPVQQLRRRLSSQSSPSGPTSVSPGLHKSPSISTSRPPRDLAVITNMGANTNSPPGSPRVAAGRVVRSSVASGSTQLTDTTTFSSLFPGSRPRYGSTGGSAVGGGQFGTLRTVSTEATSMDDKMDLGELGMEWDMGAEVSQQRTQSPGSKSPLVGAKPLAHRRRSIETTGASGSATGRSYSPTTQSQASPGSSPPYKIAFPLGSMMRERRPSETAVVDLTRVAEEVDDEGSVSGAKSRSRGLPVVDLGDEAEARSSPTKARLLSTLDAHSGTTEEEGRTDLRSKQSGPKKLAVVGGANLNPESSSSSASSVLAPRRPSTRPRHSVDAPGTVLRPRETSPSPDGLTPGVAPRPGGVILRRNSTKAGANRHGMYIPRERESPSPDAPGARVPFPRAVSGSPPTDLVGPITGFQGEVSSSPKPHGPLVPRGRYQSEIDGNLRRRPRPSSYDELGASRLSGRSRYESMINLGGGVSNASVSDLRTRDSLDSTSVRQTLIVQEDGKTSIHFQLGNCIGRGQFGSVYRALNLNNGQTVAVKRVRLEGLSEDDVKQLMREVDLVKRLSHPSIVKYEGMVRDSDALSIVLEYAENGSLGQTLKSFGKLNEKLVASYVVKILEGLDYLHRSDVVHCDLKAANILTTKTGNVKLSDFGVSLNLRQMEKEIRNEVAGTPNWMAPEVIELKGASPASDIWSLGCTVVELLTGRPPYAEIENGMSVMFRIVEDKEPPIPEDFSYLLKDFLRLCFQRDPSDRPSAEQLCEHEWLKENWSGHRELRQQESIPFLRRVSTDLQKSAEAIKLSLPVDIPRTSPDSPDGRGRSEEGMFGSPRLHSLLAGSPPRTRLSDGPPASPVAAESEISTPPPREHTFVGTLFSKPIRCHVCAQPIKKHAQICAECNLICHPNCRTDAVAKLSCGLRTQWMQLAQYAQDGDAATPFEMLARQLPPPSPMAQSVASPSPTPDSPTQSSPLPRDAPPTAFKMPMFSAFKRSRSSLNPTPEPGAGSSSQGSTSLVNSKEDMALAASSSTALPRARKTSLFLRNRKDSQTQARTLSAGSSGGEEGGTPNRASLRSAATAGESVSSSRSRRDVDSQGLSLPGGLVNSGSGGRSVSVMSTTTEAGTEAGFPGPGGFGHGLRYSVADSSTSEARRLSEYTHGVLDDEDAEFEQGTRRVLKRNAMKKRESKASSNDRCSLQ